MILTPTPIPILILIPLPLPKQTKHSAARRDATRRHADTTWWIITESGFSSTTFAWPSECVPKMMPSRPGGASIILNEPA